MRVTTTTTHGGRGANRVTLPSFLPFPPPHGACEDDGLL